MSEQLKVVFAPGCFDDFEGTQEELDEFVAAIHQAIADPNFLENSLPLDSLAAIAEDDPELAASLEQQLDGITNTRH